MVQATEPKTVKASSLVFDYTFYPRHHLNDVHVLDLANSIKAGEVMPPVVIEKSTKRIVDGFHRVRAALTVAGEGAEVQVIQKTYKSDTAMFLDAIELNAQHGQKLDRWDVVRIIEIAENQLHVDPKLIAGALHTTQERVETLALRVATSPEGVRVPLKASGLFLKGGKISEEQMVGIQKAGGHPLGYYVNQLLNALTYNLIDIENKDLVKKLNQLRDELDTFLVTNEIVEVGTRAKKKARKR